MTRAAAALGALIVVGCAPTRPLAPVRSTLAPSSALAPALAAELAVAHAGPRGKVTGPAEITLVFTKPLRDFAQADAPVPALALDPPLPGHWEWVGTRALRFSPDGVLPAATRFGVTVPSGVRAADGSELAAPFAWTFETGWPLPSWSEPVADETQVATDSVIRLRFDQPVDPDGLLARLAVTATPARGTPEAGTAVPVNVRRDPDVDDVFVLEPRSPLPADARIHVAFVDPAAEGAPTAEAAWALAFRTRGPLRALGLWCAPEGSPEGDTIAVGADTRCAPEAGLDLALSSAVEDEELLGALLESTPGAELEVGYADWGADEVRYHLHGSFAPASTLRVALHRRRGGRELVDDAGSPLVEGFDTAVSFGDRASHAVLALRGTYRSGSGSVQVPIAMVNVHDLAVAAVALGPEQVMARLAEGAGPRTLGTPPAWHALPTPARNDDERRRLDLAGLLGEGPKRGAILVRARYRPGFEPSRDAGPPRELSHELQLTDLALYTRVDDHRAHVLVLDATTTAAVAGASVELRTTAAPDAIAARATTDAQGSAVVELPAVEGSGMDAPTAVVFVRRGDDWAYHRLDRPAPPRLIGSLFTDRGLYRPGETVRLKGVVRRVDDGHLRAPEGERLQGVVQGDGPTPFARFSAQVSSFGTFDAALLVPDDAPLGFYRVSLRALGADEPGADVSGERIDAQTRFRIAAYHPVEFAVNVAFDHDLYVRGDALRCEATGRYLHGGAMAGARVRMALWRSATSFQPGVAGYWFGGERGEVPDLERDDPWGELDGEGRRALGLHLELPGMSGPEQLGCEAGAVDLDQRAIGDSASVVVHPSAFYLGLALPPDAVEPGEAFAVKLLAATPRSALVSTSAELGFERVRELDGGQAVELLDRCVVAATIPTASCRFVAPPAPPAPPEAPEVDAPSWLRLVATATDPRGNPVRTTLRVSVATPPEPASSPGEAAAEGAPTPAPEPESKPEPVLSASLDERETYVGDVLPLQLTSPVDAPAIALVSVERETVLAEQIVPLPPAGALVRLPVVETMVPGASVRVVAFRGAQRWEDWTNLNVAAQHRRLSVQLQPSRTTARPGSDVDLAVRVTDAEGRPVSAEVALWGADEGTLELAWYHTPDPFAEIYDRFLEHGITDFDTRAHPLGETWGWHDAQAPRVRMGATSVTREDLRADFRQTVLFEPRLRTDASGQLTHRVTLPDGLTTYRFMAVAVTEAERLGSAEASVMTNQPLMARPSLPAVVRAGDEFGMTVTLSTLDLPATDVDVEIACEGLVPSAGSTQRVRVPAGKPVAVRFNLAAPAAGPYRLTVRAHALAADDDADAADAVTLDGRVLSPAVVERVAIHGVTSAPVAEAMGDLSALRPDVGGLEVRLSTSRLVGIERGFDDLLQYPHGCAEQTASRMLPLVALPDIARAVGAELPRDPGAMVEGAALRLAAAQRADGGFGFWSASKESEPWLSAWVLSALQAAARSSSAIDPLVLARGRAYLETTLAKLELEPASSPGALAAAAHMLDVLAVAGLPIDGYAPWLVARASDLSPSGRALLLHALVVAHGAGDRGAIASVRTALESAIRLDGRVAGVVGSSTALVDAEWFAASDAQASALALRALVAADPQNPLLEPLARGLVEDAVGGSWRSTHETAWALLALADYHRVVEPERALDARVFLGDSLLGEHAFEGHGTGDDPLSVTLRLPMSELLTATASPGSNLLTFDVTGGPLYYDALLSYAPRDPSSDPIDRGFAVEQTIDLVAGPSDSSDLRRVVDVAPIGALLRVEVSVVSSAAHRNVALEVPLPGGLEAVDATLRDDLSHELAAADSGGFLRRELGDEGVVYFADQLAAGITTVSFYARARHAGRFVAPPTRAYEMYAPEVQGSTAAGRLAVTP